MRHLGAFFVGILLLMIGEVFIAGLFGLIVGSFLNVVILRYNTGRSTAGRSGCMSCRAKLTWRDLVPVLSYMYLRGRCAYCESRISHQYWLVELITAVVFGLVWMQGFPLLHTVLAWAMMATLIVIVVYDIHHTIIPNPAVYLFIALGAALHVPVLLTLSASGALFQGAVVIAQALVVAFPLFVLWAVSRGRWMGFGDVKLVLGFGIVLGVYYGLMSVMWGFILGAVIGLLLLYLPKVIRRITLRPITHRFTMKTEVPFAPFLILGFMLVFFFNLDFIELVARAL